MNSVCSEIVVTATTSLNTSGDSSLAVESEQPDNDHELMLAVRDGEIARLGDLFERHHGPLYGFFYRVTGERTLSEDLVQLVFYRILKYRHTYRDEGKFSAWMYHLGRRVVADHYRKQSRQPLASSDDVVIENIHDEREDSGEQAQRRDDLQLMQKAFRLLPEDQREILTLHRFQRLPHQDIATLLGCSVGATKVRLHRAIKGLRDRYQKMISHEAR